MGIQFLLLFFQWQHDFVLECVLIHRRFILHFLRFSHSKAQNIPRDIKRENNCIFKKGKYNIKEMLIALNNAQR
jgi:hypothetical protein